MNLDIRKGAELSLTRQLYDQLRKLILNGDLPAGEKLPSTRELAASLNISRNVTVEAYELLIAEGFLEGRHGSGTYVATGTFWEDMGQDKHVQEMIPIQREHLHSGDYLDFRSGIPDLSRFPRKKWAQLTNQIWLDSPKEILSYNLPAGSFELRELVAQYLKKNRGALCTPEQIIITSGSVQGLSLTAQVMVQPGSTVIIEDPANCDIAKIFAAKGAVVYPVPVDTSGLETDRIKQAANTKLIMVTPSHQFPLGGILPIQRRIELIRFAQQENCYIIEDDYDSEFRYDGPPVSSLQGLDPERVIYLGTFSKILFPAVRLGYIVVPRPLFDEFCYFKKLNDIHSNTLNQLVLAKFIREGLLDRHVAKMKKIYRKKRDLLVKSLKEAFPENLEIYGSSTGLHLVAGLRGINFNKELINHLEDKGVCVYPVEDHTLIKGRHTGKIIMGYGHLEEDQIAAGVELLKLGLVASLAKNGNK